MSSILDLFTELCAIPSPPGNERAVTDRVTAELRSLGLEVEEDDAGVGIDSNAGNLLCRLPGRMDSGTPIFLCAHLDTVPPQGALEPVVEDGVVRNAAGTILGADNKSAVVAMLEAARRIVTERKPHAGDRAALHAERGGGPARSGRLRSHEARGRARLRLRPGGADRRGDHGRAVRARADGALSRPPRPLRDGPGGGPLRHLCRSASHCRPETRAPRRGDDRERRHDHRRQRAEHRSRVVPAGGGSSFARRPQARRPGPGDAGHVRLSRRA